MGPLDSRCTLCYHVDFLSQFAIISLLKYNGDWLSKKVFMFTTQMRNSTIMPLPGCEYVHKSEITKPSLRSLANSVRKAFP